MPRTNVSSFTPLPVWKWDDTDDAGLVAFLQEKTYGTSGDYSVDRSSGEPVLQWQQYTRSGGSYVPSGTWREVPLVVGQYVVARFYSSGPMLGEPGVSELPGRWEADEFGRPYALEDLAVPAPEPAPEA